MNVFIIGAGFTKAVFRHAPLNKNLIETLALKSPASAFQTLRERYKTEDIEVALTRLDVDAALSQDDSLRKLRQCIESELAIYFGSFCASAELMAHSHWLTQLIDNAFSPGDVAISLNYDCGLEGFLDCRGKWTPNGGYGSSLDNTFMLQEKPSKSPVTVLKIHGSANFIIAPYQDRPAASAVNFEFDECYFPRSAKHTHIGYGAGTGRSYLIAPSYVKIPTVEITYLMLDALAATTSAKNLIIIGSALRPEDGFLTVLVTNFLRQPSWRDRKIIVVDPTAESIANRLRGYWGVDISSQILPIEGHLENSVARLLELIRG